MFWGWCRSGRGCFRVSSMLEEPDGVSSLLPAQHEVCSPAQVRDGYSFTELQTPEQGHLAPEHTQVNHQLCQRALKGTLPPHPAPLVHHRPLIRGTKRAVSSRGQEVMLGASFSPGFPPHATASSISLWMGREKKAEVLSWF